MWKDALHQKAAARSLQGPNAAGTPGMGAGPVPYASGATQWRPNREPARQQSGPTMPELPQGAGNGANAGPNPYASQQPATGAPGAPQEQMQVDPYQIMQFARSLMDRYRVGYGQARRYRG